MADPTSITIKGKELQLVTLDFETYYSQDFTLSGKMNMSEYVRDERFKAHGVSIKIGAQPTYWVRDRDIASELAKIKWDESALICHNTQFDGFIMSHHYGIVPAFYIDTLSMARGVLGHSTFHNLDTVAKMFGLAGKTRVGALLDTKGKYDLTDDEMEALGAYALDDVDDTEAIFHRMYPYLSDKELRLIDLTIRMFCDPILEVDIGRVHAEYVREGSLKDDSVKRAGVDPSDLSSNIKFAALLKARGVEPPMKESPTTGKQTYAFAKGDLDFQALLQHKDPQVRSLCEARLRIKSSIGETRAQRMLNAGDNGWKLPVALNYSGAHTHRWSGGNKMNLQNLPRGGELRLSILAPEGMHVVVADSAQIEARTLAWLAGQEDIISAFAKGEDVYKLMATKIYNTELASITGDQRFIGKICVAGDTKVLTDRGWVPILYVTSEDKVWDGVEWVSNDGLLDQGFKATETAIGLTATPDHEILVGSSWEEWHAVHINPSLQKLALSSATLPSSNGSTTIALGTQELAALAELNTPSTKTTSSGGRALGATYAQRKPLVGNDGLNTQASSQIQRTELDYSTGSQPVSNDVTTLKTKPMNTMENEASTSTHLGAEIEGYSYSTCSPSEDGMPQNLSSTGSTVTEGTDPGTCDSFLRAVILEINDVSQTSSNESEISKQKTQVYDLLNCGPRSRYTVLTNKGPMIISNCVLGLGYGMGAAKLQHTLAAGIMGPPVEFSLEECQRIVNIYRSANYAIKDLWAMGDRIITDMSLGTSGSYGPLEWGAGFIRLPNGMFLQYPDLECEYYETSSGLQRSETTYRSRSGRTKLYGGILIENIVQALARIIVAEQMLECADITRVVTTTHDEIVAVHSICEAPKILERMIDIMSTPLEWCQDLPLSAEGGHARNYSK